MRNAKHKEDFSPIDPDCECRACQRHNRAYLRHLFQANEILASRIATYHNLAFYVHLMENIRASLKSGNFIAFRNAFIQKYQQSEIEETE